VCSAGFVGPGRQVPEYGITVAQRRGLDLTRHRSRLVTPDLVRRADLVVVMDPIQARDLRRAFPFAAKRVIVAADLDPLAGPRDIADPWLQPLAAFEASYERLDRCAATLAKII